MGNKAKITVSDTEYVFELDRKEIVRAELKGLSIARYQDTILATSIKLWVAGLHKNNPTMNDAQCETLYDVYLAEGGDVGEIISFLMEEYQAFSPATQTDTAKKKATFERI